MKRLLGVLAASFFLCSGLSWAGVQDDTGEFPIDTSTAAVFVAAGASTNTVFAQDSFTDTSGTSLVSHSADVGGAWTLNPDAVYSGLTSIVSNANRGRNNGSNSNVMHYTGGTAASADMEVQADFVTVTNVGVTGIMARESTSADTGISCRYNSLANNAVADRIELADLSAGTLTDLATASNFTASGTFTLKLEVLGSIANCYKDGVLVLSGTTSIGTGTKAGVRLRNHSDTIGIHVDNFIAKNR